MAILLQTQLQSPQGQFSFDGLDSHILCLNNIRTWRHGHN